MVQNRTLLRSGLIAATATVSLLATSGADAAVTVYNAEGGFLSDVGLLGGALSLSEDFEAHDPITNPFGYAVLSNPLDNNPNGVFTGGIVDGLTVANPYGGNLAASVPSPYTGNITSTVVGALSGFDRTDLLFDNGQLGVGFNLWGIDTQIDNPPTDVQYSVFDTGGGLLASGTIATPDSANGEFLGFISDGDAIGSISLRGLRFGADTTEFVDDVQAYVVPGPGALALLGLAGMIGTRRRRG